MRVINKNVLQSMEAIHRTTCKSLDVDFKLTFLPYRFRELIDARRITTSIARELLQNATFEDIAFYFKQDHSTAIHSIKRNNEYCEVDKKYEKKYNAIRNKCLKYYKRKHKPQVIDHINIPDFLLETKKLISSQNNVHLNVEFNVLISRLQYKYINRI